MKRLAAIVCLSLCASCSKKSPPKIESLQFPVVILFGNSATRVCKDPADLTMMHTNYVVLSEGTQTIVMEKNRVLLFRTVQQFLEEAPPTASATQ